MSMPLWLCAGTGAKTFAGAVNLNAAPKMLSMVRSLFAGVKERDGETIKEITRKAYPAVAQLSTVTLAEWMQNPIESFLLIDVRSAEEFAVSHLRGSVNLQSLEEVAEAMRKRVPARTVLYCSVGFRSSRLASALADHGMPGALNLEGSIFQWVNEGRPVFQGEQPVGKVHPYGKRWAGLLKPGLASEC
jgi:rhodanese-related sulfurtransferase